MSKEKVLSWLRETGFPLEMTAAAAFRSAGFDVQQSATYVDPHSEKGREIDVLAEDPDWFGLIDLSAILECKSSSNPWVVLTSKDAFSSHNRLRTLAVMSEQALLALSRGKFDKLKSAKFFHQQSRCGYGFRQAFSKGNDPGYGAAMNVVSACYGFTTRQNPSNWPNFKIAIPVIVIDSPLFECEQNKVGELELVEVQSSQFLFSAHFPRQITCLVRVVTKMALPESAGWAKSLVEALREDLQPEEEKFIASLNNAPMPQ